MKIRIYRFWVVLSFICLALFGCKTPLECKDVSISIENRWYDKNGGIEYLKIEDKKDIVFICQRIKKFKEGKEVRVAYSYGDIDVLINKKKLQAIFTYRNGVVYRVSPGKYVYDEALTKRIMKLMKIKNRCWGEDCK